MSDPDNRDLAVLLAELRERPCRDWPFREFISVTEEALEYCADGRTSGGWETGTVPGELMDALDALETRLREVLPRQPDPEGSP